MTAAYRPRPTSRRRRRTREEMEALREVIYETVALENPMTVRQVFYRLVTTGAIAKTENEYKTTVVRLLTDMRVNGELPFDWIADNTRWMRKPNTHSSIEQALRRTIETYRRSLWDNQDDYVEIWLEKDALAGVIYDVTGEYDVPLMVTRGYPSVSFLYSAAENIIHRNKPTYLYYFGDYDPSGLDIPRNVQQRLEQFAPDIDIEFTRIAVTAEQIRDEDLSTRPTKRTDTRSNGFRGESVELDAIQPDLLRGMVRWCIERHIHQRALESHRVVEASERELATVWEESLRGGAP